MASFEISSCNPQNGNVTTARPLCSAAPPRSFSEAFLKEPSLGLPFPLGHPTHRHKISPTSPAPILPTPPPLRPAVHLTVVCVCVFVCWYVFLRLCAFVCIGVHWCAFVCVRVVVCLFVCLFFWLVS